MKHYVVILTTSCKHNECNMSESCQHIDDICPYSIVYNSIEDNNRKEKSIIDDGVITPSQEKYLENEIMKYFGFSEISNYHQMVEISKFCRCLELNAQTDHFKNQFSFYQKFKAETKSYRHSFKKFLGNQSKKYQDGAWNSENWQVNYEQLTSNNGKSKNKHHSVNLKKSDGYGSL